MVTSGKLSVQLKADSMFLGRNTNILVRDSSMRLVKQAGVCQTIELPTGLYEISAVLEDGHKHRKLVQVKEGDNPPITLGENEEKLQQDSSILAAAPNIGQYVQPRFTKSMAVLNAAGPDSDSIPDAELLEVTGVTLVRQTRTLWFFRSEPILNSVPTALMRIQNRTIRISLPVSPGNGPTENSCVVKLEKGRRQPDINAWISPERRVANALQNMLASGYLLHAAKVADHAVELLQDKYRDPTGAALGALILNKVGSLQRWSGWVENLARDFDWLPDGKILLANLLYVDEPNRRPEALQLAIQASKQRILYSESFSLLLDMLRRWVREHKENALQEALENLAMFAPDMNWDSICLNNFIGED